jgi:hypothetical protein
VEDCRSGNILACPSEERRMITAVVIADSVVGVVSSMSSHATIVATPELLLEHYV